MAITVRTTQAQDKNIDKLKLTLQNKTASGALLEAAKLYPKLTQDYKESQEQVRRLERELETLKDSIVMFTNAKERMIDLANNT